MVDIRCPKYYNPKPTVGNLFYHSFGCWFRIGIEKVPSASFASLAFVWKDEENDDDDAGSDSSDDGGEEDVYIPGEQLPAGQVSKN
jgi:hypothetical protein